MLEKASAVEVNGLLLSAAANIRDLVAENIELKTKLASVARQEHAEKIASVIVGRGQMDEDGAKDYARSLRESDRDLNMVEDFVKRSAPGVPLGHTKTASEHESTPGDDVLTNFLKTSIHE